MILSRRSLLAGASALLAAPAIVRVSGLMPISTAALRPTLYGFHMEVQRDGDHITQFGYYPSFDAALADFRSASVIDPNPPHWKIRHTGQILRPA